MEDFTTKPIRHLSSMLKTKFDDEYMGGFWDHLKFWWFLRKVKALKKRALWEANIDKYYFETNRRHLLEYDDTEDRKFMQSESYKPEANRDQFKLMEANDRIAEAKAVKRAYRENETFRTQVKIYLEMLKDFNEETKA